MRTSYTHRAQIADNHVYATNKLVKAGAPDREDIQLFIDTLVSALHEFIDGETSVEIDTEKNITRILIRPKQ